MWTSWCRAVLIGAGALLAAEGEGQAGTASAPGEISARSTLVSLGIRWRIAGDDNENAQCTVRFRRKGTAVWREALPLFRVRYEKRDINALAGSIFHLAPGTAYEVRLALSDPDGGAAGKALVVATRALPRLPSGGATIPVEPGRLAAAERDARPGDILELAQGDHGPGFTFTRSGAPGRPIVYRGPDVGEAVIRGPVRIAADHIRLDRLTIRMGRKGCAIRGDRSARGVAITRCRVLDAHYAIGAYGDGWTITDNVLVGDKKGGGTGSHMSGEGVEFGGRGHAAAFNEISWFADGASYGEGDIDLYNNLIHDTTDDFIEPDYAFDNYRIWHNRCWTTLNGISFQPIHGGPWYIFGNQITGTRTHTFKLRSGSGPRLIAGNTFISSGYVMNLHLLFDRLVWVDNLWAQLPKGRFGYGSRSEESVPWDPRHPGAIDYNAYATGGEPLWRFGEPYTLRDMQRQGLERHSLAVRAEDILVNPPSDPVRGTAEALLPKAGCALIDAGTILPNIAGPYARRAPDIGACERGFGIPWAGPRRFTPDGLGYGLPDGWRPASKARVGRYVALGAPPEAPDALLLIARKAPAAFILVRREPARGETRWRRFEEILGEDGPTAREKAFRFRDGLGGRIRHRMVEGEGVASLFGARVEPDGVLVIAGGCAEADLAEVAADLFTFIRSLYH